MERNQADARLVVQGMLLLSLSWLIACNKPPSQVPKQAEPLVPTAPAKLPPRQPETERRPSNDDTVKAKDEAAPVKDWDDVQPRHLWLAGNYAEAEEQYRRAVRRDGKVAAFIGLARVLWEVGRYEDALQTLEQGLQQHRNDVNLLAERGELLYRLGRWDEASQDIQAALKLQPDHLGARWTKARLLRDQGDQEVADKEIRWIVRAYTESSGTENEIRDAERLLIIGQAGTENARRHRLRQQFAFIRNEIYPAALKAEEKCWQAHYLAALLLIEKHNQAEGETELDEAMKINPRSADVLAAKGRLAWLQGQVLEAVRYATQALETNPRHLEALLLLADVQLLTENIAGAEEYVVRAIAAAPRSEAAWARRAVLEHLKGSVAEVERAEKEVTNFCRTPGVWHLEMAELYVPLKRYALAERHYQQALKLRPDLPRGIAGLALLYWQLGREEEARPLLDKAFEADPFHVRVFNALQVLKHLSRYARRETEHFVIRYSEADRALAAWLADDLEQWYDEYKKRYGAAPTGKVVVEIMASREMFSGRVLALPGLPGAAQGASTGPLLVIPSLQADGRKSPYNWDAVVRHELTHVFNLQQSDYHVPIWLTEGLAVRAEGNRRFLQHRQLLRDRLAQGTLYDLLTIARGYHHFARPQEVIVAYYQGWLYVEYLAAKYGDKVFPELLAAYRQGLTTADAIQRVCGTNLTAFERDYRQYVERHVRHIPASDDASVKVDLVQLEHEWKKNPDDVEAAVRLARAYLREKRREDARRIAEQVWKRHPCHAGAALILAQSKQDADLVGAIVTLEDALAVHVDDVRLLQALLPLLLQAEREERALQVAERLRQLGAAQLRELAVLAELYAKAQRIQDQISVLAERAQWLPDDGRIRRQLAELCEQREDWEQAARWAEAALRIDVEDEKAKEVLEKALLRLGREMELKRLRDRYRP